MHYHHYYCNHQKVQINPSQPLEKKNPSIYTASPPSHPLPCTLPQPPPITSPTCHALIPRPRYWSAAVPEALELPLPTSDLPPSPAESSPGTNNYQPFSPRYSQNSVRAWITRSEVKRAVEKITSSIVYNYVLLKVVEGVLLYD